MTNTWGLLHLTQPPTVIPLRTIRYYSDTPIYKVDLTNGPSTYERVKVALSVLYKSRDTKAPYLLR